MAVAQHRQPNETFAGYTQLYVKTCRDCGIMFAMPEALEDECRENHSRGWQCPNGHKRHYVGKTEAQQAAERADRERDRAVRERAQREQAESSAAAQRRAATRARNERNKARKRHADGVCPVCTRSFKQLRTHVAKMHPDYDPTA